MSRLPALASSMNTGLTEWSDSQHNSRLQAPQTYGVQKAMKREVPPPGKYYPVVVRTRTSFDVWVLPALWLTGAFQLPNLIQNERLLPTELASILRSRLFLLRRRDPILKARRWLVRAQE